MAEPMFWADQIAREILEKWEGKVKEYVTESGLGASGIPHVGSAGDGIRAYMVTLALRDLGAKSSHQAFSDDRDGLRKVPDGFPNSLEKEIGKPVSMIKDPFSCHSSFGEHMSSLLTDALEKAEVEFKLQSADRVYKQGKLDREIVEILGGWKDAGKIMKRVLGQKKFLKQLPFFAICEGCGRLYTTRVTGFLPKGRRVTYECDSGFMGKNSSTGKDIKVKGCGHSGETSIRNGKLAWKVEFAARWKAFKVCFEAYGKDILDSIKTNDEVCRKLLGWEPPVHTMYEMFVQRGGQKISKSLGNVFTPQVWLEYGSPESLRLLMLKRLKGTRVVDLGEIPKFMDETDYLEKVYSGEEKVASERDLKHMRRLYEYVHMLKPVKPKLAVPYSVLVNMVRVLPVKDKVTLVSRMLQKTGHVEELSEEAMKELERRVGYADEWVKSSGMEIKVKEVSLSTKEKKAFREVVKVLGKSLSAEELQHELFEIAKKGGLRVPDFFRKLYQIILGIDRGPRAGELILMIGRGNVKRLIEKRL